MRDASHSDLVAIVNDQTSRDIRIAPGAVLGVGSRLEGALDLREQRSVADPAQHLLVVAASAVSQPRSHFSAAIAGRRQHRLLDGLAWGDIMYRALDSRRMDVVPGAAGGGKRAQVPGREGGVDGTHCVDHGMSFYDAGVNAGIQAVQRPSLLGG